MGSNVMSVSQAAMGGLNALMSLGAKAKPITRDNEDFKAAMADASVQHTRSKPRQEKPEQANPSQERKPSPGSSDSKESAASPVVEKSDSPQKEVTSTTQPDDEGLDPQAQPEPVEQPNSVAAVDEGLDPQAQPEPVEQPNSVAAIDEEQEIAQPAGEMSLALLPLAEAEQQSLSLTQSPNVNIESDADSEFILGPDAALAPKVSVLAGLVESVEDTQALPLGTPGATPVTSLNPLAAGTADKPSVSGAVHLGPQIQVPKALNGLTGGVVGNGEDPITLTLSPETEGEPELKAQIQTVASEKTLLGPSQKVLTAALMQAEPDLLKAVKLTDSKASTSSALDPSSSITGAGTNVTSALNSRMQPLTVPVSQPHWAQATGERVLWMVTQKLQTAEIQLDPPELGPLQVKVSVQHDQVSITFVSHSPQVRDALDQHALRLREMFEGQGLDLVDVDVSDQSFQQGQDQSDQRSPRTANSQDGDAATEAQVMTSKVSSQLVDAFV